MKKIEELIIQICVKIGKEGHGALIVLDGNPQYKELVNQDFKPFYIESNPKLLQSLALTDGAVLINKGIVKAFGVMIERSNQPILQNYGTRHQAGVSASLSGSTCFVVSEEDRKVRIMKKGQIVMQLDCLDKDIEKNIGKATTILESAGVGAVATYSLGALGFITGLTMGSGIIVFGTTYYLINLLGDEIKRRNK